MLDQETKRDVAQRTYTYLKRTEPIEKIWWKKLMTGFQASIFLKPKMLEKNLHKKCFIDTAYNFLYLHVLCLWNNIY